MLVGDEEVVNEDEAVSGEFEVEEEGSEVGWEAGDELGRGDKDEEGPGDGVRES